MYGSDCIGRPLGPIQGNVGPVGQTAFWFWDRYVFGCYVYFRAKIGFCFGYDRFFYLGGLVSIVPYAVAITHGLQHFIIVLSLFFSDLLFVGLSVAARVLFTALHVQPVISVGHLYNLCTIRS